MRPLHKIVPLESLRDMHGILVHGCFDLLHVGHIRYFMQAWKLVCPGDALIATTTSDDYFPKYKNRIVPAFPEDVRAECLAAMWMIDYVAIVRDPTAVPAIQIIKPRIYFKGWEAKGIIPHEQAATEENGGKVVYMEKESESGQIYSSGRILSGEYLRSRTEAARLKAWPFPPINTPTGRRGVGEGDIGVE